MKKREKHEVGMRGGKVSGKKQRREVEGQGKNLSKFTTALNRFNRTREAR